jgi:nitrite reductase/ring-hydroxylating ferredoxin subunit
MASMLRAAVPLTRRAPPARGVARSARPPAHLPARSRRAGAPARAQSGTTVQSGDDGPLPPASVAANSVDTAAPPDFSTQALEEALSDAPGPAASFDWHRHWYAVAALDALERDVPNAMTILGQRVAVWLDNDLEWRALRDECPHRLAPLSEGRVAEDGTLQVKPCCSCHGIGWLSSDAFPFCAAVLVPRLAF